MKRCILCHTETASMRVDVRYAADESFTLPSRVEMGDVCFGLFESRHDAELATRLSAEFEDVGRAAVVSQLRRQAGDISRIPAEATAVVAAREQGFVPLREITGVGDTLGPLWPEEHRLWLDELDDGAFPEDLDEDDRPDPWLVRSPWAPLSVPRVLSMLWRWVGRIHSPTTGMSGPPG